MWQTARVVGAHGNLKVILLADLAKVPLIGWGLRLFEFVFIEKGRHHQQHRGCGAGGGAPRRDAPIDERVASFAEDALPSLFLIFPEGERRARRPALDAIPAIIAFNLVSARMLTFGASLSR